MPRYSRESEDTIDIGRGNHHEAGTSYLRPVRRSSSFDDRNIPNRHVRYVVEDEYRYRDKDNYFYERPSRPVKYPDNDNYERWQEISTPVPHHAPPLHMRRSAQRQMVGVRPRPRSPSLIDDDDDRDLIVFNEVVPKPVPPVGYTEASEVRRDWQHVPGLFQTVFDVNHPQDASVYLELPIADDHETELETFFRLQRLGNFRAAQEYFNDNLEPYLSNPYVFVQYGQMLLDKGDYLAFERLNPEAVFGKENRPETRFREFIPMMDTYRSRTGARSHSHERGQGRQMKNRSRSQNIRDYDGPGQDDVRDANYFTGGGMQDSRSEFAYDELELLRQNWRLLKAMSTMHMDGNFENAFTEAWYAIENFQFGPGIGSTEIQIVMLALHLCAHIGRVAPERYNAGLQEAAEEWIDWPALFKELFVEGRIWDFKDLYVAAVAAFFDSADELFFGTDDVKRSLIDDWVLKEDDESTNLAQLDLLLESAQLRPFFLEEAKSRAEAIMAHSPAAMKSQPFIRWIIANAADTLSSEEKGEDDPWLAYKTRLQDFPGMMVWHSQGPQGWTVPSFYVPRNGENPGWVAPDLSRGATEPCQLALNLAKELEDYKSQVACYKVLISQSQDPAQLLKELADLQKFRQGDKQGHLETLLSTYLVCKDRPAKKSLLEELEQTNDWGDATILRDQPTYWARDFIERALKRNLEGPKSTAGLRNPTSFYMGKGLPLEVEQFTRQNAGLNGLPPTSRYPLEPHIRQGPASPRPVQAQGQHHTKPLPYLSPYEPAMRHSPWPEHRPRSSTYLGGDHYHDSRGQSVAMELEEEQLAIEAQREEDARRRIRSDRERVRIEQEAREQRPLDHDREHRHEEAYIATRARAERQMAREWEERAREKDGSSLEESRRKRELQEYNARMGDSSLQDVAHLERERRAREIWIAREQEKERRVKEEERIIIAKKEEAETAAKRARERQQQEIRDRQDRDFRERLKRAEESLQDQAERLKRAEDRQYQGWHAGRKSGRRGKARGSIQVGGIASVVAASQADSDSYYSDSSPSSDDEKSVDDTLYQDSRRKGKVTGSAGEEQEQEAWHNGKRAKSNEQLTSESSEQEADHHDADHNQTPQQNLCTALVLYSGVHSAGSPDASLAGAPLSRSPTSRISSPNDTQSNGAKGATRVQIRRLSKVPSISGIRSTQDQEPALEQARTYPQIRTDEMTAEPQKAVDHLGSGSKEYTDDASSRDRSSLRETKFRDSSAPRSKEQNERIASRPPRVVADLPAPRRRETDWDNIIAHEQQKIERLSGFAEEENVREKAPRRVTIDTRPSSTHAVHTRPRSMPSSTQVRDGTQPLERRTSWRENRSVPSHGDRVEAPKRRSSLVVDANGRPQLLRTTSDHRRSYVGNASSSPYIHVQRDESINGVRSVPEMSPTAAGKRPQQPVGSRSHFTDDTGARIPLTSTASSAAERQSAEDWEKGRDGGGKNTNAMSTLREDPEEEEEEEEQISSRPRLRSMGGQSSIPQGSLDADPGVSRKPTVTEIESGEE